MNGKLPLHINFKYKTSIRSDFILKALERAVENALKHNFLVTHYTLQSNHIHLIAEAQDNNSLSSGMRCITVTLTRAINMGSIQLERYHLHVLKTPQEVVNAVNYVLHNDIKHTGKPNAKFTKIMATGNSWLLKASTKKASSKQRFARAD